MEGLKMPLTILFDIKNRLNTLEKNILNATYIIQLFHMNANIELLELKRKVLASMAAFHMFRMKNEGTNLEEIRQSNGNIYEKFNIANRTSYSVFNPLVYIKRYWRQYKKLSSILWEHKQTLLDLNDSLLELEKEISLMPFFKSKNKMLDTIAQLKLIISYTRAEELDSDSHNLYRLIEFCIELGNISKNDLLSVISINRDYKFWQNGEINNTWQIIQNAPIKIDLNTFDELIVKRKIEHEQDSFLADIHIEKLFDIINTNSEMKNQMMSDLGLDTLPTFHMIHDEYGNVVDIKQKANLKLIE
jgi:hypothetical protein